jgi:hypothetical protein
MTIRTYVHSKSKRAELVALVDLGATENFMNLQYAEYLQLPIKRFTEPRRLLNVNGTPNKGGTLQFYTDLNVQTGTQHTALRFFLSELGDNKVILGYPWFAAVQPRIDWKRGWIDHAQLPVILKAPDVIKARFLPRTVNRPRPIRADQFYVGRIVIDTERNATTPAKGIPTQYQQFTRVFSEDASHEFPPSHLWDHAIELKPGTPSTLPG